MACAGPETIGPLAGLMMSDDLHSTIMPDTPSQDAVVGAAETRPPLAAAEWPAARFVRHLQRTERLPGNVWGCASVIGLCPTPSASLSGVVGCVVTSRASHCLQTVCDALRVVIGERSVLLVGCCTCKLRKGSKMSQRHRDESENSSYSSDYHWDGLPSPMSFTDPVNPNHGRSEEPRPSPVGMQDHTEIWGYPTGIPLPVVEPPWLLVA